MQHFEMMTSSQVMLLNEIIQTLQIAKERNLTSRFLMATCGFLKRKMALTSVSLLKLVLEIFIYLDEEFRHKCLPIIGSTCLFILSREAHVRHIPTILGYLNSTMDKHFSLESKKFFLLFKYLSEVAADKVVLKTFMNDLVLPLIDSQIGIAEKKQGSGINSALRYDVC